MLAARRRVHRLRHADRGEVAVALVREHHMVGQNALHAGRNRGSATVSSLDHVATEEIVGHDRAADGSDAYGLALDIELVHGLAHKAMNDAVRAPRAIVSHHRQQRMRAGKHKLLILRH